ncbi:hypothetical protein AVEN_190300-1 [Araneus ventricosus]|uniref:Uncharacterized protein n=1 Tax=Araneus ventricosus TaxID=182803 RepID=A0A4Y1ZN75_ARAVE|nr:hypothetical protein AVEN_190300-1 [Araneus ventricosus]
MSCFSSGEEKRSRVVSRLAPTFIDFRWLRRGIQSEGNRLVSAKLREGKFLSYDSILRHRFYEEKKKKEAQPELRKEIKCKILLSLSFSLFNHKRWKGDRPSNGILKF